MSFINFRNYLEAMENHPCFYFKWIESNLFLQGNTVFLPFMSITIQKKNYNEKILHKSFVVRNFHFQFTIL